MSPPPEPPQTDASTLTQFSGVFGYTRRAIELVWSTGRGLTVGLFLLTLVSGVLPAAVAYFGKLIVDAVVLANETQEAVHRREALTFVLAEGVLVALLLGTREGLSALQSLLRALLGFRVNVMVLEKALTLELTHFEDSEVYDQMTRVRREASRRPLSLVKRTFDVIRHGLSLLSYGGLLISFSPWALFAVVAAAIPAFIAETKFAGAAFRLFQWRTPETREQTYLEAVLAREDYAKEVKLFGLGERLLQRYREIFDKLYADDKSLTLRRSGWGFFLRLISTATFYGAYGWIAVATIRGSISLGEMTMYLLVFKQGQQSFAQVLSAVGGMYEDNLYLSNLYAFLEIPIQGVGGEGERGPQPDDGIRFENVSFTYPGANAPAIDGLNLHLRPGTKLAVVGENGSGKTTLIKLMTRLYEPQGGRILLEGRDLREWDPTALRQRIGVIFQDFARYQFPVGENIGAGDVSRFDDEKAWEEAGRRGMAHPFVEGFPEGYRTQLGRWFKGGRELSIGQWQKVALSRAFMRSGADILVLDEPTSAMDAEAEAQIFEHVRATTDEQIAVLISHRFSTVRMADEIVVLDHGTVLERGTHEELMEQGGRYATLFTLQARGYQ